MTEPELSKADEAPSCPEEVPAPGVSLVGPALNEAENLPEFVERCLRGARAVGVSCEVIVIDDGSTDDSPRVLRELQARVPELVVVTHRRCSGMTGAIRSGLQVARGALVVVLPTDLQSRPDEDLPALLPPLLRDECDVMVGHKKDHALGGVRRVSSWLFNLLCRRLFSVSFRDLGWVKAFRREVAEEVVVLRSDWHRYFVIFAAAEGFRTQEVPLSAYERSRGESSHGRFGFARVPRMLFDIITIKFLISFSRRPIFAFGGFAALFGAFGLGISIYLVSWKLRTGEVSNRLPLLFLSTLSLLASLQFLAIGFLAEMFVTLGDDVRRRSDSPAARRSGERRYSA